MLIRAWNHFSRLLSVDLRPFPGAAQLWAAAAEVVGYEGAGDETWLEGLDRLVGDFNHYGGFHHFGRFYVGQFLHGLLVQRLHLGKLWAEHPEILQTGVARPLVIVGLPRTGTSFLFNLLARDPAHRYLANWEASVSQVPPGRRRNDFRRDPRRRKGRLMLAFQKYLMPEIETQHAFLLDGPEECTPILMQGFATQAFAGMFDVPDYSRWLDTANRLPSYRHHRRVLQTLQWTYPGQRWLLKSPDHVGALDALLRVYPDACVVCTHRDPVSAVTSWASLARSFRGIYYEKPDQERLGKQVLERLARDTEAFLAARGSLPREPFFDVDFSELVERPLDIVQSIYERFGLPLADETLRAMQAYLAEDAGFRPGRHRYRPEDFGLSAAGIRARFTEYSQHFGQGGPGGAGAGFTT